MVDTSGNSKQQSLDYATEKTLVAQGGDYLIIVARGSATAYATAKPGKRTRLTVR